MAPSGRDPHLRRDLDIFTELGVDKVRLTGGEPLLRANLSTLVNMLAPNPRIKDLAITTNGVLLMQHTQSLYDAGLHRVTVSLDTHGAERFKALTKRNAHDKVLAGIQAIRQVGFKGLNLNPA